MEISWGDQRASVVEVGGGIRRYEVGERAVLDPYPVDEMCDGGHGAPLIPWPNRLADGRYHFDGADYQLPLTEPDRHNAIHGLLRWQPWQVVEQTMSRVRMGARLYPLTGYPFHLDVEVDYALDEDGLRVTTTATNAGTVRCPYGAGQHPYLSPGPGLVDDCTLQLGAATRILTDAARQLPVGTEPVAGTPYDFADARLLGNQKLDFAFTDLTRDGDGRAWATLTGPDGRRAELWVDRNHPIIQLYTGDTLKPHRRRRGLAAEPMTCPPNAFGSGDGLIILEPGQSVSTRWGARLS
jgi:aldose 1-epimerase